MAGVKRERPANRQDDTPRQIAQLVVRLLKRRDLRLRALSVVGKIERILQYQLTTHQAAVMT